MTSDPGARRYALAADVVLEKMGDTTVAVNLATDEIHELNDTAGRLLELLGEGKSAAEAADALALEYEAEPEVVWADVQRTVEVLLEGTLIVSKEA